MPVEKLLFVPQIQNERCVKNSNAAERENGGERHGWRDGERKRKEMKRKNRVGVRIRAVTAPPGGFIVIGGFSFSERPRVK